ncbi:tRNA (adenine(58)-N(1))-methyltransferase catalytic subunit trmt61a [Blyttiomyces sp. JEL0837]|nr:tRNA (adenine(58)-N(1))-methyltransferase catalytic subunit trmt61a [Blyttiomyces sp. JEL0837]
MSSPFIISTRYIADGDLAIAYMSPESMKMITIKSGEIYQNKFGAFPHDQLIGKEWGSQVYSQSGKGYIYILQPTPEIWTEVLPHRTQILYMADIAFVTTMLDLKPGSIVIESGTGSGSFSHSIARTISPSGHLHTFEFHEERAKKVKQEFADHGIAHLVTANHRDVCKQGFGISGLADAVFLDLPSPWEAIASAKEAFKVNQVGRLCSFSPCVEQIQKTCEVLESLGFFDIRMFEVLIRPNEVRTLHEKPLPPTRKEAPKFKGVSNGAKSEEAGDEAGDEAKVGGKRKLDDQEDEELEAAPVDEEEETSGNGKTTLIVSRTQWEVRGHTSYLLFASVLTTPEQKDKMQVDE